MPTYTIWILWLLLNCHRYINNIHPCEYDTHMHRFYIALGWMRLLIQGCSVFFPYSPSLSHLFFSASLPLSTYSHSRPSPLVVSLLFYYSLYPISYIHPRQIADKKEHTQSKMSKKATRTSMTTGTIKSPVYLWVINLSASTYSINMYHTHKREIFADSIFSFGMSYRLTERLKMILCLSKQHFIQPAY